MAVIPRAVVEEIVAHAREALPNEACGMVHASSDGTTLAVHRVTNVAGDPTHPRSCPLGRRAYCNHAGSPFRYEMHPLQLLDLERRLGRRRRRIPKGQPCAGRFAPGWDEVKLFAIYHSHVASEARPSPTDIRMAFYPSGETEREPMYPDTYYVLVSLAEEPPPVRAFHIRTGGVVEEEPLEVRD